MNNIQLKIAICDDEEYMRVQLGKVLNDKFRERNIEIEVVMYETGESLIDESEDYDIVFLDIDMPDLDGMQVATGIREKKNFATKIIFLTSFIENARNAYRVGAYRYLIKDNYLEEIDECIDSILNNERKFVKYVVYNNGVSVEVNETDILYLTARHNGSEVWLTDSICTSDKSLNDWEKILDGELFARVHIGYIVNVSHINYIDENIVLYSGEKINFSRRKKNEIKEKYAKYMCKGKR